MQINKQYFIVADGKLLGSVEGNLILLNEDEMANLHLPVICRHPILTQNDKYFSVVAIAQQEIDGYQWLNLRSQLGLVDDDLFQLAGRALQVLRWHLDHQYCGRCGKPTVQHVRDLAKSCTYCTLDFYPRLSPCIIALVMRGDYCLLAHHTKSHKEIYTCLAGFVDIGETPEQTVAREVLEEVSISVNNIRYISSQAWPFPGQLMLGYFADFVGGDIMPDQNEILAAAWFRYNQLPVVPPLASLSGRLIHAFVQQRQALQKIIQ